MVVVFLAVAVNAFAADASVQSHAAWDALDKSLADNKPEHRQQALASLATLQQPDEEAVKRVERALHDKDLFVRQSAALALGNLRASAATDSLKSALDDKPEVSFAAAKALAQMGDTSGRDILVAVLAGERKDAPGMVANAMREAKNKLHHPEGLVLMGARDAAGAMFGPVSMVIPAIEDAADLKAKGAPGRAAAAAYLAKDPDPYAVALLEWALNDDNQFVRLEAAKGLGDRGNSESVPKLETLLNDAHNVVRDMAAASIIRILARGGSAGEVSSAPVVLAPAPKKK